MGIFWSLSVCYGSGNAGNDFSCLAFGAPASEKNYSMVFSLDCSLLSSLLPLSVFYDLAYGAAPMENRIQSLDVSVRQGEEDVCYTPRALSPCSYAASLLSDRRSGQNTQSPQAPVLPGMV